MKIVIKAAEDVDTDPIEIIARNVAEILGDRDEKAVISKVFPDVTRGNRARLYTVHLPDNLPAKDVSRIVERLSGQEAIEYAEVPAAKRPMGVSR